LDLRAILWRLYDHVFRGGKAARGRLSEAGLVTILIHANPSISDGRVLRYPADRCTIMANAMIHSRTMFAYACRLGGGGIHDAIVLKP
jgi:hypothetical protein